MKRGAFYLVIGFGAFFVLGVSVFTEAEHVDAEPAPSAKDRAEFSSADLVQMLETSDTQALEELTQDAESVLANYDVLVAAADSPHGPLICERMAHGVRETLSGPEKRAAVDLLIDLFEGILKEGHPHIAGSDALRFAIETIYVPGKPIKPSYGKNRVKTVVLSTLRDSDYSVRNVAVGWLWWVYGIDRDDRLDPAKMQEVVALLRAQRGFEENASDYPENDPAVREAALRRIDKALHYGEVELRAIEAVGQRHSYTMTDDEFVRLKQMSKAELLEVIKDPQQNSGQSRRALEAIGLFRRSGILASDLEPLIAAAK